MELFIEYQKSTEDNNKSKILIHAFDRCFDTECIRALMDFDHALYEVFGATFLIAPSRWMSSGVVCYCLMLENSWDVPYFHKILESCDSRLGLVFERCFSLNSVTKKLQKHEKRRSCSLEF
jgi:hypothetical protein